MTENRKSGMLPHALREYMRSHRPHPPVFDSDAERRLHKILQPQYAEDYSRITGFSDIADSYIKSENARVKALLSQERQAELKKEIYGEYFTKPNEFGWHRYGESYFGLCFNGRKATYDKIDAVTGEQQTVLDPSTFSHPEGRLGLKLVYPSPNGKYIAYVTSLNGSDAETIHIYDVEKGVELVQETIPDCRYMEAFHIQWRGEDGFYYTQPRDEAAYALRYHKLGEVHSEDATIYQSENPRQVPRLEYFSDDMGGMTAETFILSDSSNPHIKSREVAAYQASPQSGHFIISLSDGVSDAKSFLYRSTVQPEPVHENYGFKEWARNAEAVFAQIVASDNTRCNYIVTDAKAPMRQLVFQENDACIETSHSFTILPEEENALLVSARFQNNKLLAKYLIDDCEVLRIYDMRQIMWKDGEFPDAFEAFTAPPPLLYDSSDLGLEGPYSIDIAHANPDDDEVLLNISGVRFPTRTYRYDLTEGTCELFRPPVSNRKLPAEDVVVEYCKAVKYNGMTIPMRITRRKDVDMDAGTAAVKLTGYGGGNVVQSPRFDLDRNYWVDQGGVYVEAMLPGDGNHGREYYEAGTGKNKIHAIDAFSACAEYLITQNITSPERLTTYGHSNGGTVVLSARQRRPDLFRFVVPEGAVTNIPDVGKQPYRSVVEVEYFGSAEARNKDEDKGMEYAPLFNVKSGFRYPPMLLKCGLNDLRVPPSDTLAMAAIEQQECPDTICLLKTSNGGHKNIKLDPEVHGLTELLLGPINQMEYEAWRDTPSSPPPLKERPAGWADALGRQTAEQQTLALG
jgi:prolyl oligopeptidase